MRKDRLTWSTAPTLLFSFSPPFSSLELFENGKEGEGFRFHLFSFLSLPSLCQLPQEEEEEGRRRMCLIPYSSFPFSYCPCCISSSPDEKGNNEGCAANPFTPPFFPFFFFSLPCLSLEEERRKRTTLTRCASSRFFLFLFFFSFFFPFGSFYLFSSRMGSPHFTPSLSSFISFFSSSLLSVLLRK